MCIKYATHKKHKNIQCDKLNFCKVAAGDISNYHCALNGHIGPVHIMYTGHPLISQIKLPTLLKVIMC
jgi:hypothetical protein